MTDMTFNTYAQEVDAILSQSNALAVTRILQHYHQAEDKDAFVAALAFEAMTDRTRTTAI